MVKNRNDNDQKKAMEKRKQQHEIKKDRTRISRRHKKHDEKGTGGNLLTENGIYESYIWTTYERNHRPIVPFLRHGTYSRSRPTRLHRNRTDRKRDDDGTRNMDKRSRRNEKVYDGI
jgi:hypothetical protein